MHTRLWQSFPEPHACPVPHGVHEPPQSTADSVPFFTPSLHVAVWQTPPMQRLLLQSASLPQAAPSKHDGHVDPPQSTADSAPFFTKSMQVGAWHVALQTELVQSLAAEQLWPVAQRAAHAAPPQSTPLSS